MSSGPHQLSSAQEQAVYHTEGPCMIIAGPGSGKTHVLTHRVAHLIKERHVPPAHLLVLTFTNKAAKEMRSRIEKLVGVNPSQLWIGTFHSLFARLLRIEAKALEIPSHFTIYDREDSKALVKALVKELQLPPDLYTPKAVLARISSAKNNILDAAAYQKNEEWQAEDEKARRPAIKTLFAHYEARCRSAHALDFDDLLLYTHRLLYENPVVAEKWQRRFRYILVDEFQDTNNLQYAILQKLAVHHCNLCVIGDDAQGIYGFRHANIAHMLSFQKNFPGAYVAKLEQNYRSTRHIVEVANTLIKKNKQYEKHLFTTNGAGEAVIIREFFTDLEEARFVASDIFAKSRQAQLDYNQFVVLYRTNKQSVLLEEALRKQGIPYQVIGGQSFYQRKEIKDFIAYLRLLVNPNDEQALYRAISLPKRGIGASTLEKGRAYASSLSCSLWEGLQRAEEWTRGVWKKGIEGFVALIESHRARLEEEPPHLLARAIAEESGLLTFYKQDQTLEGVNRYENMELLIEAIESFTQGEEHATLARFLQDTALITDNETSDSTCLGKVTLMTMHAAKGTEYPHVYIVGMEEGICPSFFMSDTQKDIEEERRLFFVAITRAKEHLTVTYTKTRHLGGKVVSADKSRFLDELAGEGVITLKRKFSKTAPPLKKAQIPPAPTKGLTPVASVGSSRSGPPPLELRVGMTVKHAKFGRGVIEVLDTTGIHHTAEISFLTCGKKKLLLQYAKVEPL